MPAGSNWTRQELLVAFALYCRLPFGRLHYKNPEIIRFSKAIGRTPGALAMKLTNIASLDPVITSTGRKGLRGASTNDRAMWVEMQSDWERFAIESEKATSEVESTESLDKETKQDDTPSRVGEDHATHTTNANRSKFLPHRSPERLQWSVLHHRPISARTPDC